MGSDSVVSWLATALQNSKTIPCVYMSFSPLVSKSVPGRGNAITDMQDNLGYILMLSALGDTISLQS